MFAKRPAIRISTNAANKEYCAKPKNKRRRDRQKGREREWECQKLGEWVVLKDILWVSGSLPKVSLSYRSHIISINLKWNSVWIWLKELWQIIKSYWLEFYIYLLTIALQVDFRAEKNDPFGKQTPSYRVFKRTCVTLLQSLGRGWQTKWMFPCVSGSARTCVWGISKYHARTCVRMSQIEHACNCPRRVGRRNKDSSGSNEYLYIRKRLENWCVQQIVSNCPDQLLDICMCCKCVFVCVCFVGACQFMRNACYELCKSPSMIEGRLNYVVNSLCGGYIQIFWHVAACL